ncbi:DUF2231 domain-containing protein [Brevundimonas sp.]|jgi:uncharacterized membrane protein|uniref:DUF2231 domain-containing protein n=1 Tax=Brevundimonas sp. TaxID=1871086 RepID=UPI0017BFB9AC|nr:DUF2231 domain-containing protein [Brevundimonas sp.]MBA4807974.1 hypothetical protein [Brevundimonas sp.]
MHAASAFRAKIEPLRGILMAFPIALFTSAVVSDIAYLQSAQMQWSNFSAWLIVGALVFGGLAGLWAIVDLALAWRGPTRNAALIHLAALALAWIFGLINAFKHSQDAWSSVGAFGLTLSILSAVLALVAGWFAYSTTTVREIA